MTSRTGIATLLIFVFLVGCGHKGGSNNPPPASNNSQTNNTPTAPQKPQEEPPAPPKTDDTPKDLTDLENRIAALESNKEKILADVRAASELTGLKNESALEALVQGQTVPFFVLVYGNPETSNFNGIRRQLQALDARPDVDENREREFTGFPYTVQMYVISLKSPHDYKELTDYARSRGRVKMIIFPIEKFKVQTYVTLTYTKSLLSGANQKFFWVGSSPEIELSGPEFEKLKLSHVTSYVPYLEACNSISKECFNTLLSQGYFQQLSMIDGKRQYPFYVLRSELAESEYLRNNKYTGDYSLSGSGWFNRNFDRHLVSNISITHEVWVSNKGAEDTTPSNTFFQETGYDKRPVAERTDINEVYFKLPVKVPTVEIPLDVRTQAPQIGMLTSQLVWTFDEYTMRQNQNRAQTEVEQPQDTAPTTTENPPQ
jgi:hypothetical protein